MNSVTEFWILCSRIW